MRTQRKLLRLLFCVVCFGLLYSILEYSHVAFHRYSWLNEYSSSPLQQVRQEIKSNGTQNALHVSQPTKTTGEAASQLAQVPRATGKALQTNSSVSQTPEAGIRVCSSAERLGYLRSHGCPATSNQESLAAWLQAQPLYRLRQLLKQWFVDEKHKVIACLHYKVGTTSWQTIFCNNSLSQTLQPNVTHKEFGKACERSKGFISIATNTHYSKEDIIKRVTTYYKLMVVRHPLDRLASAYLDKLRDSNPWYPQHWGTNILRKYRPGLPRDQIKAGKGVYLEELIQYIIDGAKDEHWLGPYNDQCFPCRVDYHAIVKLETFSTDAPPIINTKLAGRSQASKVNSFGKASWNEQYVKNMPLYANVTDKQLKGIMAKYRLDFEQFGYGYERQNRSLDLTCRIKTDSGDVCC